MCKSESHDTSSTFIFRTHQIKCEKIWKLWCFYANITPQIQMMMMMIMLMRWRKKNTKFPFRNSNVIWVRSQTSIYRIHNRAEQGLHVSLGFMNTNNVRHFCTYSPETKNHFKKRRKFKKKVKKAFKKVIFLITKREIKWLRRGMNIIFICIFKLWKNIICIILYMFCSCFISERQVNTMQFMIIMFTLHVITYT